MNENGYGEQEFEQQPKHIDLKLWKRLFGYAMRRRRLALIVVATLIWVAAIDVAYPLLSRYAIDTFIEGESLTGFGPFVFVYIFLVVLQGAGVFLFVSRAGRLEMDISYDIRQEAFGKLQELSFSFYDRMAVGYLMARLISDTSRISEMLAWSLVDFFWAIAYAVGMVTTILILNWKLALLTLTVMPFLVLACLYFQRRILAQQRKVRRINSRITGSFNEGIMGAMTSKTLVREAKNEEEFGALTGELRQSSIRAAMLSAFFMPIVLFLGSIGTGLALWRGGYEVLFMGLSFGTLSAFISYTANFFEPVQNLAGLLAEMQSAQASAERVISLLDVESEVKDSAEVIEKYGDCFSPKRENWEPIRGEVEFSHVSFTYTDGERVLDDFSLSVRAGENIALVGETGAGKSTIVNLVCRFYEPTAGRILIDGRDYRERSQLWLHSSLGYVLQSPHLFSGSIADNIRFGRRDATDEEVREAARLVHAEDFILGFEKGYDTEVGEGGGRLSTGQKQLISFARVVLADPRIFVLDEATSSVDTETEQHIQDAITHVLKGRTSFIVAHRLSTIRGADRILVIRDGKIAEMGNHESLMQRRGHYYELYTAQFREEATQKEM